MKAVMPYIIMISATFILSLLVVGGVVYFKATAVKPVNIQSDSIKIVRIDSVEASKPDSSLVVKTDTPATILQPVNWKDSVALLRRQLLAQNKKFGDLEKIVERNKVDVDSAKNQRKQQFVKLLDSMKPDEAAKVIGNMKDKDIKEILLKVKARQASKILGMMEPKRAARLIN